MVEAVGMDYEGAENSESYFGAKRNIQFIVITKNDTRNIFDETLIVDEIALVGSLGGSLGLFVGFSFFGCVTPIHNKLRWLHLLSHIVKNLSIKTNASGGLVLIILKSDANLRATFPNCF